MVVLGRLAIRSLIRSKPHSPTADTTEPVTTAAAPISAAVWPTALPAPAAIDQPTAATAMPPMPEENSPLRTNRCHFGTPDGTAAWSARSLLASGDDWSRPLVGGGPDGLGGVPDGLGGAVELGSTAVCVGGVSVVGVPVTCSPLGATLLTRSCNGCPVRGSSTVSPVTGSTTRSDSSAAATSGVTPRGKFHSSRGG